ncbi:MAG: molybdopterin-binding protein [Lachnospiraceae bacterium]
MGIVKAVCISDKRGIQKSDVKQAVFEKDFGIKGDAHGGNWHRQVSMLSYEQVEAFNQKGANAQKGAFGENLLIEGFDFRTLPVGTVFKCNDVLLEITQIGKECHTHCQIYQKMGECIMPTQGVFAEVLHGGTIAVGDEMVIVEEKQEHRPRAAVVTMSDKASRGERENQSGPLIATILQQEGYKIIEQVVIPDEQTMIEKELIRLADGRQAALIVTTGGTGFSERDCTPEATLNIATRNAPGIAEAIRAYSQTITKRAMLSRGVSVIRNQTLIINLPGSPKAVEESLVYIVTELKHGLDILRGGETECTRK